MSGAGMAAVTQEDGCTFGCGYPQGRHHDSCSLAGWRQSSFEHPYRACGLHGLTYCGICTRRDDECRYGSCRELVTLDFPYCSPEHVRGTR